MSVLDTQFLATVFLDFGNGAFSPLVIVGVASPILVAMVTVLYNEGVEIGGYTIQF